MNQYYKPVSVKILETVSSDRNCRVKERKWSDHR